MKGHDVALADRAASQLGLITRPQLLLAGFSTRTIDRYVAAGRLLRLHQNVYRVGGSPSSWRSEVLAACLAGGPGCVASHRAAAALHGFDNFSRAPVEVTSPRSRNVFSAGVIVHRPVLFLDVDRASVGPLPVTAAALTLINLAGTCRLEVVEEALDGAVRDGLTSPRFIQWRVDQLAARGRPGIGVMRAMLADRDPMPVPGSVAERRFFRAVDVAGGPRPERRFPIHEGGRLVHEIDLAWPDVKVACEVDGGRWHSTKQKRASDNVRTLLLGARGWRVVRVTFEQVRDHPALTARQVLAVVSAAR